MRCVCMSVCTGEAAAAQEQATEQTGRLQLLILLIECVVSF